MHITLDMAREAIKAAVTEYGEDWIDPIAEEGGGECLYTYTNDYWLERINCHIESGFAKNYDAARDQLPTAAFTKDTYHCIVGQAFKTLDLPIDEVQEILGVEDLFKKTWARDHSIDPVALHGLMEAQRVQDEGVNWGDALAVFENAVATVRLEDLGWVDA